MPETLYSLREKNIRKTWLLMSLFLVFIAGIGWFMSYYFESPSIFYYALIFALVLNLISYFFSDQIVLMMTHAKQVEFKDNPELYRIVENLCITAGLPMPKIYILPEKAPNAFATGRNPKNAVVAVTEGLLEKLDRSELEGVIAHELSHIGNRDILIQTVVVVLVGLVAILSDIFLRASFWGGGRRRDSREGGQLIGLLTLIGLIFIILSPLIARLIQFAISRKREFLADASGALLTRYPAGLASALEKIANDSTPMRYYSNATAHLYVANPAIKKQQKTSWLVKMFSTHPPIEERIKILREMQI
jgi:heat shock protein HtpX